MHADVAQLLPLLTREDPQRAGDVDLDRVLDRLHAVAHLRHQARVGTADRGDDAELRGAGGRRLPRRLDERRDVEPDRPDRGLEPAGLRAEVAVLRAPAGLQADDPLDLDLGAAPAHPHFVGKLERVRHALLGQLKNRKRLSLAQPNATLEHLLARNGADVVGPAVPPVG